jgi:hypothetical protein
LHSSGQSTAHPHYNSPYSITDWLSARGGVIAFTTPEEAVAGAADIAGRYEFHAREARVVMAEYFDAGRVLPRLVGHALTACRTG